MKTWEDLKDSPDKMGFIISAINDWKGSPIYSEGVVAYEYFKRRNVTINKYRKLLYTLSGDAVPDNYSANYKFCNSFFQIFVRQENSYLLGNGVTFNDDATKDALGGSSFDTTLMKAGLAALWGGVSFGFLNYDKVKVFDIREFVPLFGEEDGGLHAGIRFWQIASDKPLRATLFEEDGYTEYIWRKGIGEVLKPKMPYRVTIAQSVADGTEILNGQNYPSFPIVPLWANEEHQSEFTGLREKIDGYDLIQSGFANDLDDASQIYWTITNAGGMDDVDLAKFIERLKVVRAAVVDDQGSTAEAHTLELPYQARQAGLADIRDSLYRDAMAFDSDRVSAGNITATAIDASYQNLDLKCDGFETCVNEFIQGLLLLLGIDDAPAYKRNKIVNEAEITQVVLSAAAVLDDETILNHIPFISPDEVAEILKRKDREEADRFDEGEEDDGQATETDGEEDEQGI